jgi:hypothetical protein
MVSVLASNAVDRGLESWSGKTKDYKIDNMVSVLALNAVTKINKLRFPVNFDLVSPHH